MTPPAVRYTACVGATKKAMRPMPSSIRVRSARRPARVPAPRRDSSGSSAAATLMPKRLMGSR